MINERYSEVKHKYHIKITYVLQWVLKVYPQDNMLLKKIFTCR